MTPFDVSRNEAFLKTLWEKEKLLVYKQFLLFPQCFLLCQRQKLSFLLHYICRLQMLSIWSGPKFCRVGMVQVEIRGILDFHYLIRGAERNVKESGSDEQ